MDIKIDVKRKNIIINENGEKEIISNDTSLEEFKKLECFKNFEKDSGAFYKDPMIGFKSSVKYDGTSLGIYFVFDSEINKFKYMKIKLFGIFISKEQYKQLEKYLSEITDGLYDEPKIVRYLCKQFPDMPDKTLIRDDFYIGVYFDYYGGQSDYTTCYSCIDFQEHSYSQFEEKLKEEMQNNI